ncbi:uncharacterized protein NECHADRAFT_78359 [Fusarium vanettenii 77-13-4]|uniref:non-specific serine/threonine protein kinase n=1 Tax=Fusarium vanettenii (strain ATCC MYA-4622 / CBS 123669 / FGSC 9596 / NRRL 45880 / 77-13-4) TaxID=660122 RepID=C7ZFK9_FUSV7|nr:uncharacterized protein NECHADRAFT_78359 [Fusarium vanettenii 77-13-4]EEU37169.1 hypothetical protein NECHADRAFT_78359 [Fusarium vanettenii 77-13-4]
MVWPRFSRAPFSSGRIQSSIFHRFHTSNRTLCRNFQMQEQPYRCDVDAEPLYRYQPGGYHPLRLGQVLKNGRYRILHKLGWGSYSTTWAAKDEQNSQYVAVKISVADMGRRHELDVLRAISAFPRHHPGWPHLNHMLDNFTLDGPNGTHDCLVLELVGPNVADAVASYYNDDRLPAKLAKLFAKQTLQGLDLLASHDIGHGVRRLDGKSLERNVPSYLVRPAQFWKRYMLLPSPSVKIIDYGEAFFNNNPPNTLHTPLSLFELVTGQPPFDVFMLTPPILVQQMMEFATDRLPTRWQVKWQAMKHDLPEDEGGYTLPQWLEEIYFDDNKRVEFTREDIASVAKLVERMLKFEPSLRIVASDAVADAWFDRK